MQSSMIVDASTADSVSSGGNVSRIGIMHSGWGGNRRQTGLGHSDGRYEADQPERRVLLRPDPSPAFLHDLI